MGGVLKKKLVEYYKNGNSTRQIAAILSYPASKIRKILLDMNVEMRSAREGLILKNKRKMPISKRVQQVIDGELLGDGCILKKSAQANFSFSNSKREYAEWLAKIFADEGILLQGTGVREENYYHKYHDKYYTRYAFRTLCSQEFTSLEHKWYNDRIKIIPEDIKITPTTMLHWYLGDGTLPKKEFAILCTDCFTKKEISFLIKQMNILIGIKASLLDKENRIFIPKTSVPVFLEYIGAPPVKSLDYKWNLNPIGKINTPIDIKYDDLYNLYIVENMSRVKVASKLGCSKSLIDKN